MRICFFGYMNISKKEGASLSLLNVMEEMVRRGYEVFFVTTGGEIVSQMEAKGIQCVTLLSYTMRQDKDETGIKSIVKYKVKDIVNRIAVEQGKRRLKDLNIDVVHINGIDNHVGAAIASVLHIPYYWHIRQFLQEDLGKRLVGERKIMQYLKSANGVIGISKAVKTKYEASLGRLVQVIYNGIPLNNYDIGDVVRFDAPQVKLILAGRITENKGQEEAVKAIGILVRKGINHIHLTLVGNAEQEYLHRLHDIIDSEKLGEYVTILDYCDNLNELRRDSDIGLVCSRNEAFGRVTIEYMCAEMLVIGANTGGTIELVSNGETGLLYKQGDAESLAEQIEYAISHKEDMKAIAQKGKEFAFDSFSIERVCDEIIEVYQNPNRVMT